MRNTNSSRGNSRSGGRTPFKKTGARKAGTKSFGAGSDRERDSKRPGKDSYAGRRTKSADFGAGSDRERDNKRPGKDSYAGRRTKSADYRAGSDRERDGKRPGKDSYSGRRTPGSDSTGGYKSRKPQSASDKPWLSKTKRADKGADDFTEKRTRGQGGDRPARRRPQGAGSEDRFEKRPYGRRTEKSEGTERVKKAYGSSEGYKERKTLKSIYDQRENESPREGKGGMKKTRFSKKSEMKGFKPRTQDKYNEETLPRQAAKSQAKELVTENLLKAGESIRLNRYISNAGVCSRREADELIAAGLVSINGEVVTELGTKVKAGDVVRFNGEKLNVEAKVYILLNKPKDAITTADDPEGRNTVMDIFEGKLKERIFPVGRLDRNTTGVLLLTNDGELAQRLMHPKYEVKKVYRATLNKNIKSTDIWTMANGLELEDGFIKPDAIAAPDPKAKNIVGVEIHSGRNRIIHRMFEHMGYVVDKLDRVLYAGLEKGNLKRGEWRELTEKELKSIKRMLHMK